MTANPVHRSMTIVVTRKPLKAPSSDVAYWRSQLYADRLAALETIRQEFHQGQSDVQSRLQSVYRIVKRASVVSR